MWAILFVSILVMVIFTVRWFGAHTGKYWTGEERARDTIDANFWGIVASVAACALSLYLILASL